MSKSDKGIGVTVLCSRHMLKLDAIGGSDQLLDDGSVGHKADFSEREVVVDLFSD